MEANPTSCLAQLRVTSCRVGYRALAPWRVSGQPEVMIRGALGGAMLGMQCTRRDQDCSACLVRAGCVIADWYDPALAGEPGPRPFVLRSLTPGGTTIEQEELFELQLTLVSPCPRPAALVEALVRAGRRGLGAERTPQRLAFLEVQLSGESWAELIRDEIQLGPWPGPQPLVSLIPVPAQPTGAKVSLASPMQLKGTGRPRPQDVVNAALQRVRTVARLQGIELNGWWPDLAGLPGGWEGLEYVRASRYSKAQAEEVDISGWRGVLHLGPEVVAYADVLAAATLLHVGRKTSAGLGRIEVEWG